MVAEIHIFEDAFSYMDAVTTKYMTDGAASVAGSLQSVAYTLLTVYVILWGWSMIRGLVSEPITDATSRIIRMAFIITFATNSAMYAHDIATFFYNWPPAMASVISGTPATSITQLLDQIAANGLDLASQAWQAASIANIGAYFVSIILFAVTIIITSITAFIIISAKLGLALLLALGPLFILMMLFESTKDFFSKWLTAVFTCGITIVLASMVATLFFKYFDATFAAASADAAAYGGVPSLAGISPAIIFGLISAFFIMGIPHFAAGLGGGASGASAGALSWAYDKIKGTAGASSKVAYKGARGIVRYLGKEESGGSIKKSNTSAPATRYRKVTTSRKARLN